MKSKIEWLRSADGKPGYSVNPIKGLCPIACEYCYARRMYKRFKWNPRIRYDDKAWDISKIPIGSKVFVGSTMELFGDWVEKCWLNCIFDYVKMAPDLTFIFLTKRPENLAKWSPFPPNCWVGVSITDNCTASSYVGDLANIKAAVKFVSIEPLLNWVDNGNQRHIMPDYLKKYGISWLIIGQQTPASLKTTPKIDWIADIVESADKAKIPVFLKNNLAPLLSGIQ